MRGRHRRARERPVGRLAQELDRGAVAGLGAAGDVVGARDRVGALRLELGSGTPVRRQPPTLARALIDRPAKQWMAKHEVPGGRYRAHQPGVDGAVDQLQRALLLEARDPRGEAEAKRLARDCGAVEQPACLRIQRAQLLGQRCRDGRGNAEAALEHLVVGLSPSLDRRGRGPAELLEVEGVAAGSVEDRVTLPGGDLVREELGGVLARERTEVDELDPAVWARGGERVVKLSDGPLEPVCAARSASAPQAAAA